MVLCQYRTAIEDRKLRFSTVFAPKPYLYSSTAPEQFDHLIKRAWRRQTADGT